MYNTHMRGSIIYTPENPCPSPLKNCTELVTSRHTLPVGESYTHEEFCQWFNWQDIAAALDKVVNTPLLRSAVEVS